MHPIRNSWPSIAFAVLASVAALTAVSQEPPYQTQLNQPGKDVQWVPTPAALVEKMLDLATLKRDDLLVDLGSGDGVLVIAAARRGVRARGIEYDAKLVEYSKRAARDAGVERLTKFVRGDIFKTPFEDASVVTTFLLPSMNLTLLPRFLSMKPGTRIVANTFAIGEWQPDSTVTIEPCERWCKAMLWIVPARAEGTWRTPKGLLVLTQKYQFVSGSLGDMPISDGRLKGHEISFAAGGATYTGTIDDYRIRLRGSAEEKDIQGTLQRPRR
jgi:hypothetical protein